MVPLFGQAGQMPPEYCRGPIQARFGHVWSPLSLRAVSAVVGMALESSHSLDRHKI